MSTTGGEPTLTFSTPPSSSPTDTQNNSGSPPSSALYLLTFLATLFVLLFISCAIVLRSFILRRRFRRRVQAQIAAGLLPPHVARPSRKRDFGEKPKIWDVSLVPSSDCSWQHISPLAAKLLDNPNAPLEAPPQPLKTPRSVSILRSFPRRRRQEQVPPQPTGGQHSDAELLLRAGKAQVAVLVSMPRASTSKEDSVPEVCIGVSEMPLRAA